MLDANIKAQLKAYFEKIESPIVLEATLDDSTQSAQMLELLNEVAELRISGQRDHPFQANDRSFQSERDRLFQIQRDRFCAFL